MVVLLPRAGDAGQDDQAFGEVAQLLDARRQAESSKLGMMLLTRRATSDSRPRCLKRLTRKRHSSCADDVGEVDAAFLVEDLALLRLAARAAAAAPCLPA